LQPTIGCGDSIMLNQIDSGNIIHTLLSDFPDLCAIYLFGSAAEKTRTPESDLDLAILPHERPLDRWALWQTGQKLASLLHLTVDLIDLLRSSAVMRMQVVSKGKLLYQKSETDRECFEDYVYSAYLRLNESRREILQDIKNRGTVYG
jgi:predicted nucleotidyltransferase